MRTAHQIFASLAPRRPKLIDFSQFAEAVGEDMPDITPDKIGKYRLQQVLRRRFGTNYKNHPLSAQLLKHFDTNSKVLNFGEGK